jgi:Acetyltransferase (GNAT) domain
MRLYRIDPTSDARWNELVQKHPKASVFHTVGWLRALSLTYGYKPVVFTTSSPTGELKNGLVFCHINSWLTGSRLVSLPFSDHCEPLTESPDDVKFLIRYLRATLERREWKYLEIRPVEWNFRETADGIGLLPAETYYLHTLDLRPDLNQVFRSLDKDCVQRRVERAERAGLIERCGASENLLKDFYPLFVSTRGRHHVPPVPYAWFRNLMDCQGPAMEFRLAYQGETPIAAILTLRFRNSVYYKYGCSGSQFNRLGAMPWLLWRAIAAAKSNGATDFDFGRTDEDNEGLLAFKNHWVPLPEKLVYWRFPEGSSLHRATGWKWKMAKRVFSWMPDSMRTLTGRVIYRHVG